MKKIAVVEDNPDNRLLVQVILEPLYEVVESENGFVALAGLPHARPDLVLLDISLPEMDGTEVLRRLRADATLRPLPVIALTAHAMAGDREKFIAAGFDDYVTKPIVDENLLLAAIRRLLPGETEAGKVQPANEPGSLNLTAIERLCKLGGNQFAAEMIGLFISYGGTKVAETRLAQQAGNLADVAAAAHPVKSSAGNVGAVRVQELAAQIEQSARDGKTEAVTLQVDELERAFAEVAALLEAEMAKLKPRAA